MVRLLQSGWRVVSEFSFLDRATGADATISSAGNGTAGQSASLTGSISVVVVEVTPNGNAVVYGEKQLGLNETAR